MAAAQASEGAATSAQIVSAHARLVADPSIQLHLPVYQMPKPPAWMEPVLAALRAIGPYLIYLFWGAIILGALLILFLIVREVLGVAWRWPWQSKTHAEDDEEEQAIEQARARVLLEQADALARNGDYEGAVHLLLRRSVEDIGDRLPDFVRPSLTARDIAGAASLPERARTAFGTIAMVVEAAVFARAPVGVEGWNRARAAYSEFIVRGAWTRAVAA